MTPSPSGAGRLLVATRAGLHLPPRAETFLHARLSIQLAGDGRTDLRGMDT